MALPGPWEQVLEALDPAKDEVIRQLTDDELVQVVREFLRLLEVDRRAHLQYMARNLRRRVLYYLTPRSLLGRGDFNVRDGIEEHLRKFLDEESAHDAGRRIRNIVIELYWSERRYDYAETVIDLARRDGAFCWLCGYQFRQSDTDIAELKSVFTDAPYPPREGVYDCLKPLSKKVRLRRPTVDHLVPLDSFGRDAAGNFRLNCEQCNSGKQNYISFVEPRYASGYRERKQLWRLEISEVALVYSVIARDGECIHCHKKPREAELTLVPTDARRCIMFDTLRTVCYACDDFPRRWKRMGVSSIDLEG